MSRFPLFRLFIAFSGVAVLVGSAPPAAGDTVPDLAPGESAIVAGTGDSGSSGDGGNATAAQLDKASGVAVDSDGAVYIADAGDHRVRRVAPNGTISTFAGTGADGYSGDGGQASDARLSEPRDVAVDSDGVVYIADTGNHRLRRVAPNGAISTLAGSARSSEAAGIGDNGPASRAVLRQPRAVAAGDDGTVYIGQRNRVRRVAPGGTITTVAGSADQQDSADGEYSGEDGPAEAATLDGINGISADGGTLYIVTEDRLLRVGGDDVIRTLAGTGDTPGAPELVFGKTSDVAVSADGSPYLVGGNAGAVRVDTRDGAMTVVGGGHGVGAAMDSAGNLYSADGTRVTVLGQPDAPRAPTGPDEATDDSAVPAGGDGAWADKDPGTITTIAGAGDGGEEGSAGDSGAAQDTRLELGERPGIAVDTSGNLYVAEEQSTDLRVVDPEGAVSTFAGGSVSWFANGGSGDEADLETIHDVGAVAGGAVSLATSSGVVVVASDGVATRVAGDGPLVSGDAPSHPALPHSPYDMAAVGGDGTIYLAEHGGARVHAVDREGAFNVVAGTGDAGFSGDGGPAEDAEFDPISALAVDPNDDTLYVADTSDRIRRVDPEGTVTTVVGADGAGVPFHVSDLAVDAEGTLYVAAADGHRIYRVAGDGTVSAIAGDPENEGSSGDGGPALEAELAEPGALALDGRGNLYVADSGNDRIRVIVAAADAPGEAVEASEQPHALWGSSWAIALWSLAGLAVLALAVLAVRRPTEVMISAVAWGITVYTPLRERWDRIRGRGGARNG